MNFSPIENYLLEAMRTSPPKAVFLARLSLRPEEQGWNLVARFLTLLRIEDSQCVEVSAPASTVPTLFELQILHLVAAVRLNDFSTIDEVLDWLLPRQKIPLAHRLLFELSTVLSSIDGSVEPPRDIGPVIEGRIYQLLEKPRRTGRPRLRLVEPLD